MVLGVVLKLAWLSTLATLGSKAALASEDYWIGSVRANWIQSESRKVVDDFAGNLIVTDDPEWQSKWLQEPPQIVTFSEENSARVGDKLWVLIFYVNPQLDENRNAHVSCDIRVLYPSGSPSLDLKNIDCYKGPQVGSSDNVRLATPTIQFVAEDSDPLGVWDVVVNLRDENRGASMRLNTRFELVK